jgi:hypothetical protein
MFVLWLVVDGKMPRVVNEAVSAQKAALPFQFHSVGFMACGSRPLAMILTILEVFFARPTLFARRQIPEV